MLSQGTHVMQHVIVYTPSDSYSIVVYSHCIKTDVTVKL